MEALLIVGVLACPLGMLAMMGGMAWMARHRGSEKAEDRKHPYHPAREVTDA